MLLLFKFVIRHAGEESILTGTLILFRRSLGLQLVLFPSSVFLSLLLYLWMVLPMYIILPMCIIVHYCIIYWIMNVHLHVYRALSPPWFCRQSPPTTKICPRSDDQNFKSPWLLKYLVFYFVILSINNVILWSCFVFLDLKRYII